MRVDTCMRPTLVLPKSMSTACTRDALGPASRLLGLLQANSSTQLDPHLMVPCCGRGLSAAEGAALPLPQQHVVRLHTLAVGLGCARGCTPQPLAGLRACWACASRQPADQLCDAHLDVPVDEAVSVAVHGLHASAHLRSMTCWVNAPPGLTPRAKAHLAENVQRETLGQLAPLGSRPGSQLKCRAILQPGVDIRTVTVLASCHAAGAAGGLAGRTAYRGKSR